MTIPSKSDIQKKIDFKASLIKKIGGERATEKSLCAIIRSNIRQSWMMHPVRLLKLEETRLYDMDTNTRTKFLWQCECCLNKFKGPDVQTDHRIGNHTCKTFDDVESYARAIMDVTTAELQILCKSCHLNKTYSEKHGVSIEYAKLEREVIDWVKPSNTSVEKQKKLLTANNLPCNNGPARRDSYRKLITPVVEIV